MHKNSVCNCELGNKTKYNNNFDLTAAEYGTA